MAQFDIYINPLAASRDLVPFVVDVQSTLIDQLPTRLVLPISRVGASKSKLPTNLCPTVEIGGEKLSLMPHLAAPFSAKLLRKPVASLAHRGGEIAAALDAVLSGF